MNACLTTTSLMQRFHRLFGVLVFSLFSFQVMATETPVVVSVGHRVTVAYSKVQFDSGKGVYSTQVRIKNRSDAALYSPLRLSFDQTELKRIRLQNAHGVGKDGQPYFEFKLPKEMLSAKGVTGPIKVVLAFEKDKRTAKGGDTKDILSTLAAAHGVSAGVEVAPLEPRAEPYALNAESGKVNVRFSVRLVGKAKPPATVYLRRSGDRKGLAMNDQGKEGDLVAKDGIHGVSIPVDVSKLKPDTCLYYEAFINIDRAEVVSSPLSLCVSSFPVRVAASNTTNPVVFPDGTKAVADEILITAKPDSKSDAIRRLAADINARVVGSIPPLNLYQLKLSSPASSSRLSELVTQLNTRSEVKAASVNAIGTYAYTPSDTLFANQHGLQRIRAQDVWDIGAIAAGSGVIVTVLDSGLDKTHPDFGASPGNCQLADDDCGSANTDTTGHGTQVAGVVAAKTNNALGVAGVAYGSKIKSIVVNPSTVGTMAQGFTDARTYGLASVINASFSSTTPWGTLVDVTPLCNAINSAVLNGATPVAVVVNAAGNYGSNSYYYPGRCNVNDLVTHVGQHEALTRKDLFIVVANSISSLPVDPACAPASALDERCGSSSSPGSNLLTASNYGAWVDMAAPGTQIQTTAMGGGYASPTGTSFSSPMVSGAAAILKSCGVPLGEGPSPSDHGIEYTLKSSAVVPVLFPDGSSAPRLDVYLALKSRNRAPAAVTFINNIVYEKSNPLSGPGPGVEAGTLDASDPDTCDNKTFTLVAGTGDTDNAAFTINGNKLSFNVGVSLDFITKPGYFFRVRVTDFFGATSEQSFTVNVVNVNDAPAGTDATVSTNEDTAHTFSAADFGFTDPADSPANNLSAVIITTLPAAGQLALSGVPVTAGQSVAAANLVNLTFAPALHAHGAPYTSFTFQVVDDGGTANGGVDTDPTPNTLTINVTHVNHAPTGVPIINGTRTVGQTLTSDISLIADADGLGAFSYQWKRSGVNVGVNNSAYTLLPADYGGFMSLCVSYTDGGGTLETPCSGPDATAVGDPHMTTVDGLHYDFQGAGEFVNLRGDNGMEIQARQTPVSTASPLTDGYSGLTSGVSINTAVAARVGNHRVTFQPNISGNPASSGLELRVDGVVTTLPADGLDLGSGGRVVSAPGGGIQIDFPDQTTMIATPGWWAANSVWYLNVSVLHTSAYDGIMGARAKESWLPRLADGTALGAMPAAMHDRYVDLYVKFADSWRVNNKTSLFDYAKDTSTRTFTFKEWPRENPPYVIGDWPVAKPVKRQVAQQLCLKVVGKNNNADCMFDVMVMGDRGIAKTHLLSQKIRAGLTSIIVRDDRDTSRDKEVVTFTATVMRHAAITRLEAGGKAVPAGTVQFTLNGNKIGESVKLDAKGQAGWKVSRLKVEKQQIGARYIPAKGSVFLASSSIEVSRSIQERK